MPERKNATQTFKCQYCGEKNQVSISLSDLDFEGNNPSMRVSSERNKGTLQPFFICQWCKRKNALKH